MQCHLRFRELVEDALNDQIRCLGGKNARHVDEVLGKIGGPADRTRRISGGTAEVNSGNEPVAHDRLPERVEEPIAVWVVSSDRQCDLDEARVIGHPLDLGGREAGNLRRHHDRSSQSIVSVQPFSDLPIVNRAGQSDCLIGIVQAADSVGAEQDRLLHNGTKDLLLDKRQPWWSPVDPALRLHSSIGTGWIGLVIVEGTTKDGVTDLLHPKFWQIGQKCFEVWNLVVYTGIDSLQHAVSLLDAPVESAFRPAVLTLMLGHGTTRRTGRSDPTERAGTPRVGVMSPTHHSIDYIELAAPDLAAAKKFYSAALGWEFNDYGPDYAGIKSGEGEAGGLDATGTPSRAGGQLVIIYSDDLEATQAAIVRAGGKIITEPYSFPGGRRLHFTDPAGNELAVWAAQ